MASDERRARRSFVLAAAEGLLFGTGMSVTHESLVLGVMLRLLGAPAVVVGSISAIRFAGWSLPQLFVASALESRPKRMPIYSLNNGVRFILYFIMAAVVGLFGRSNPALTIGVFLVVYTLSRVTAGIAAAARSDILGKVIKPVDLSQFFATRNLLGSVGGFFTGFLISFMLGEQGPPYPWNYAALFALSGVIFFGAWFVFCRIKEPPSDSVHPKRSFAMQADVIKDILRNDKNYVTYLLVRIFSAFVEIAAPFYALYAVDRLGITPSLVGLYLSMMTLARMVATPIWGKVGQRWGAHVVIRSSALLDIVAPLLAIGLPLLGEISGRSHAPAFAYIYGLVFLANGIASPGRSVAFAAYLLDLSPPASRPTYIGLASTVGGCMELLTIGAGQAIDLWGYTGVFATSAAMIALGALLSFRLRASTYRLAG